MAEARVRVWLDGGYDLQHLSAPPDDDTTREWHGETICGRPGTLRWISPENVDAPTTCAECQRLESHEPLLEGEYPGPP